MLSAPRLAHGLAWLNWAFEDLTVLGILPKGQPRTSSTQPWFIFRGTSSLALASWRGERGFTDRLASFNYFLGSDLMGKAYHYSHGQGGTLNRN